MNWFIILYFVIVWIVLAYFFCNPFKRKQEEELDELLELRKRQFGSRREVDDYVVEEKLMEAYYKSLNSGSATTEKRPVKRKPVPSELMEDDERWKMEF